LGKEAAEIGLIAASGTLEEVNELTEKYARKLARSATQSVSGTKITMNVPLRQAAQALLDVGMRSEEHTSELQSLMRSSSAAFCLEKKNEYHTKTYKKQY